MIIVARGDAAYDRTPASLRRHEAADVVCLLAPKSFYAVGLHSADVAPVDDGEVPRVLDELAASLTAAATSAEAAAPDGS